MTVVVSAGNSADAGTQFPSYNSIESPGTAPSAITVGASTNRQVLWQRVRVEAPDAPRELREINTLFGDGPKPEQGVLTAPLRDVSKLGDNGLACAPLTNGSLSGAIALIRRGECQLELKINHAQRAGAVGVIVYQGAETQFVFRMQNLDTTGVPAVLIGNRDGRALADWLNGHPDARVTLDTALVVVDAPRDADLMAYFSSRGPSIRETAIKPEVTAPGTDMYVPVQNYDSNGDMYSPDRYTVANGTSFAAPIVAGVAAIVQQLHPDWTPQQIKSAIVNTADARLEDLDENDRVIPASVLDGGAGILDAGNAARTNLTVAPSTIAFDVWGETRPAARQLTFRNSSNQPMALQFSVVRPSIGTARVVLEAESSTLTVPANGTANLRVSIEGNRPPPGVYEGEIVINNDRGNPALRVPYVFFVPDGTPFNILPILNQGFEGDPGAERTLTFKVTDRFGLPVSGLRFDFQPTLGGGRVVELTLAATDDLGIGEAIVELGPQIGEQEFFARVGNDPNFGIFFGGYARPTPVIESGGVRNAASGQQGLAVAPGSYVAIYGRALSPLTKVFNTPYLPLSLTGVSVSFDVPSQNLSVPGRLHFVSDSQINVQVPWELQGVPSALMKVSIGDTSSALYTVRMNDYSPGVFEYTEQGTGRLLAAARDERLELIGTGNPAMKGRTAVLYVNGLGPVDEAQTTGEAAPFDRLIRTRSTPSVTVGGRPAVVDFSGLAPGAAGLYQLNVRLAEDTPSGLQPVVLSIGGIESKAATLPVQ
jgi:uncharacterized protein (TIGR03437 family)